MFLKRQSHTRGMSAHTLVTSECDYSAFQMWWANAGVFIFTGNTIRFYWEKYFFFFMFIILFTSQTQEIYKRCLAFFSDNSIFFISRWPFKQNFSKNQKTWLPKGEKVLISKSHYYSLYQLCVVMEVCQAYWHIYYYNYILLYRNRFQYDCIWILVDAEAYLCVWFYFHRRVLS